MVWRYMEQPQRRLGGGSHVHRLGTQLNVVTIVTTLVLLLKPFCHGEGRRAVGSDQPLRYDPRTLKARVELQSI